MLAQGTRFLWEKLPGTREQAKNYREKKDKNLLPDNLVSQEFTCQLSSLLIKTFLSEHSS